MRHVPTAQFAALVAAAIALGAQDVRADCVPLALQRALTESAPPGGTWFLRFATPPLMLDDVPLEVVSAVGGTIAVRVPPTLAPGEVVEVVDAAGGSVALEVAAGTVDADEPAPTTGALTFERRSELRRDATWFTTPWGECGRFAIEWHAWRDQLDVSLPVDGTGERFVIDVVDVADGSPVRTELLTRDANGAVAFTLDPGPRVSNVELDVFVRDADTGLAADSVRLSAAIPAASVGCPTVGCAGAGGAPIAVVLALLGMRRTMRARRRGQA